jgi:hypothetical protein
VEFLRYLLEIELERLETARRIERERSFIFPETTVIIRDILKLRAAILADGAEATDPPEVPPRDALSEGSGGDLEDLLRKLQAGE